MEADVGVEGRGGGVVGVGAETFDAVDIALARLVCVVAVLVVILVIIVGAGRDQRSATILRLFGNFIVAAMMESGGRGQDVKFSPIGLEGRQTEDTFEAGAGESFVRADLNAWLVVVGGGVAN